MGENSVKLTQLTVSVHSYTSAEQFRRYFRSLLT